MDVKCRIKKLRAPQGLFFKNQMYRKSTREKAIVVQTGHSNL